MPFVARPERFKLTGAILLLLTALSCHPSPYITQKNVVYNFKDEGFLSPDVAQTIGRANFPENLPTLEANRTRCLESALNQASQRMVSIFLHTYFDIEPRQALRIEFNSQYPHSFSRRDYIRAGIDFESLLKKGFVALQDARSRSDCLVVYRISISDLPSQIRAVKLTFRPENLKQTIESDRNELNQN